MQPEAGWYQAPGPTPPAPDLTHGTGGRRNAPARIRQAHTAGRRLRPERGWATGFANNIPPSRPSVQSAGGFAKSLCRHGLAGSRHGVARDALLPWSGIREALAPGRAPSRPPDSRSPLAWCHTMAHTRRSQRSSRILRCRSQTLCHWDSRSSLARCHVLVCAGRPQRSSRNPRFRTRSASVPGFAKTSGAGWGRDSRRLMGPVSNGFPDGAAAANLEESFVALTGTDGGAA